jgi:uncharacterized protein
MKMALQIIIDGYNFIGKQKGLRGDIEGRRDELIRLLARYRAVKGYSVTVVFDGWRSGWPDEHGELREGIHVIFSRHGEKADQVIGRMARKLGHACIAVSSDREVAQAVEQAGGVALRISEFERRLMAAFKGTEDLSDEDSEQPVIRQAHKRGNPRRLSKTERKKRQRLGKL